MRQDIYDSISRELQKMEDIRHIDMWNRNVEFIEEESGWMRPAVFVEIMPVKWRCIEPREDYRSRVRVRLHIVTDWVSGSDGRPGTGEMFDLPARIHERLGGLSGERFYGLDLSESVTNHDHGELLEMIEEYECEASRLFLDGVMDEE